MEFSEMPQSDDSPQLPPLPPNTLSQHERRRNSSAESASDSELVLLPPDEIETKEDHLLDDIPIPSDQLYSDMELDLPAEIPLPAPDTSSSRYSPSHVLGAEEEEDITSPSDRKKSVSVLGKAQAKKRLLAFSAAKAAASMSSPTSTLSVVHSSTPKKTSPLKPLGTKQKAEPVLAIQTIKEEETQMKKMIAMNSLLADKLHQVKLIATAVPTLPEISTLTTSQPPTSASDVASTPQTAIVKPLLAVSEPTVDSSSRTGTSRRSTKKSKRRHSSTSQSSSRSRSAKGRSRSKSRSRTPTDKKGGKKKNRKSKSRSRSRSKEREKRSKKSRRSRSRERDRKSRRSRSKSRSHSHDARRSSGSKNRRREEKGSDRRDRGRRRRSEERGVKRSQTPTVPKPERNPEFAKIRKSRMPENWGEFKTFEYNFADISVLWMLLKEKAQTRDRSRSVSPSDSPKHEPPEFEQPTRLSKTLRMPPAASRLVLASGLVGDYPLHLTQYTKVFPRVQFGYNKLSIKGYYKTREDVYKDEDAEILSEMDLILQEASNEESSPMEFDRTKKSSEGGRPWWCPSEEAWCASEGSKGVVISHLYSEDEESKSPFPVMKDDAQVETQKESSEAEEVSDDESIDSTPSPLLKQRYAQMEDEPPSPLLHKTVDLTKTVEVKPLEIPPKLDSPNTPQQLHNIDSTDEEVEVEVKRDRKKKEKKKRKSRKRGRTSSDDGGEEEKHRRKGEKKRKKRESSADEEERKSKKKSKKGKKKREDKSPSSGPDDDFHDRKPPPGGGSAGRNGDPARNDEEKDKRGREKKEGGGGSSNKKHHHGHHGGRRKEFLIDPAEFDDELTISPPPNGLLKRDLFEGDAAQLDPEAQKILSSFETDEFFQLLLLDQEEEDADSQERKNELTPVVSKEIVEAEVVVEKVVKTDESPVQAAKEEVKVVCSDEVKVERVQVSRSKEKEVRVYERERWRRRSKSRSRSPENYRSHRSSRYHHHSHHRRRSDSEERERYYRYRRHYHHHHSYRRYSRSRSPVERVRRRPLNSPPLQLNVADSTISDAELDQQLKPSLVSPSGNSAGGTPKEVEVEAEDGGTPSKKSGFSSPPRRLSLDERLEREMGIKLTEDVPRPIPPPPVYMPNGKVSIPPPPFYFNPNAFPFPPPPPPCPGQQYPIRGPPPMPPPYWPQAVPNPMMVRPRQQSQVIQMGDMLRVLPAEIPTAPITITCSTVLGDRRQQIINGQFTQEVHKRVVRIKVPVLPFDVPVAQPQGLSEEEKSLRRKRRRAEKQRRLEKEKARAAKLAQKKEKEGDDEVSAEEMALLKEAITESFEAEEEEGKEGDPFPTDSQLIPPQEKGAEDAQNEMENVESGGEVEGLDEKDVDLGGGEGQGQSVETIEDIFIPWGVGPVPILPPPQNGILVPFGLRGPGNKKRVTFADGINPGCGGSESCGEEMSSPPPPPSYPYKKSVAKDNKSGAKKKKIKVKVLRNKKTPKLQEDAEPPPPPKFLYPFCPIGILYQVCPQYAVLYAQTMAEKGFDIVFEPSTQHPYATKTQAR